MEVLVCHVLFQPLGTTLDRREWTNLFPTDILNFTHETLCPYSTNPSRSAAAT
jgi:hypothetical protein